MAIFVIRACADIHHAKELVENNRPRATAGVIADAWSGAIAVMMSADIAPHKFLIARKTVVMVSATRSKGKIA